jgi:2-C-methyl-D-erythritol 4-phosphate cytidylyltransferase
MRKVFAIILSAGIGERINSHVPKQFMKVSGKTLLEHTIEAFENNKNIDEIIIVTHPEFRSLTEEIVLRNKYKKIREILNGGETRRESSSIGVNAIEDENSKVLIHDAVRPFISDRIINECVQALDKYDAVDVAIPSPDTIIKTDDSKLIESIPIRKYMMRGQTPQAFKAGVIKKAHLLASEDTGFEVTDDCSVVLKYKLAEIFVVNGEERNIKVTYPEDIYLADKLFQLKSVNAPENISLDGLKGKVVVVFGASRGIGKAIMDVAKKYGASVYGFSRKDDVDVTSVTKVSKALENVRKREKKIDYIAVTAGILRMGKIETRDSADIFEEININYIGSINVVKASIKYLKESRGSIILFTSSSYTRGRALFSVYSSAKAAIVNLVQGLAEELLIEGVKINAMNPERTATPMRFENFGKEPDETLLKPEKVAEYSLKTLMSDLTGEVVDVRKDTK